MKSVLRKWLTGLSLPQEYICLDRNSFTNGLIVHIDLGNRSVEITKDHSLVGYSPVIIAIPDHEKLIDQNQVRLSFRHKDKEIASLQLNRILSPALPERIGLYIAESGKHQFISIIHQRINQFLERRKKKPSGNIDLPGNLYDQVRIAYSIPRLISLVSVFDGQLLNIFPTDLHGACGNFYISSLRIGGMAFDQIMRVKKLVIAEINSSYASATYAMGKNHMLAMREPSEFLLSDQLSAEFKFPLPLGSLGYRELEYHTHVDINIHRIFIYRVVSHAKVEQAETLCHIHSYYAQWRINNALATQYILRERT